ncbi:glycoside hydrolase family 19 protein, partial [Streptomyces formicae]
GNDKYYGRGPIQLSWNFNYKAYENLHAGRVNGRAVILPNG